MPIASSRSLYGQFLFSDVMTFTLILLSDHGVRTPHEWAIMGSVKAP